MQAEDERHVVEARAYVGRHAAEVLVEGPVARRGRQRLALIAGHRDRHGVEEDATHPGELPIDEADRRDVEHVPDEQVVVAEAEVLGRGGPRLSAISSAATTTGRSRTAVSAISELAD